MHQRLLSEMKKRRLFYLRKTPQDLIIEELMLKHRCSQERAEQIYLKKLEDNKLIRSEAASPARRGNTNAGGKTVPTEEGAGQFLGIKGIYENIIHAASPSRSRGPSRANHLQVSGVTNEFNSRTDTSRVMRRPVSPYNQETIEVDHDEAARSFGTPERSDPKRHPYIIVKSPTHESGNKTGSAQRQ